MSVSPPYSLFKHQSLNKQTYCLRGYLKFPALFFLYGFKTFIFFYGGIIDMDIASFFVFFFLITDLVRMITSIKSLSTVTVQNQLFLKQEAVFEWS